MQWFVLGGPLMWPLLLISVLGAAIVVERLLFYRELAFPPARLEGMLLEALKSGSLQEAISQMESGPLREFRGLLDEPGLAEREAALRLAGEALTARAGFGLGALGLLGRIAPLIGLLGTILGMMQTFARIASTQGAVDMPLLAGGIWQALITTAAGLIIAVPAIFARHFFLRRQAAVAVALAALGNAALILERNGRGRDAAGDAGSGHA